uniref:Putative UDP-glucose/GDP-mannose dehydrogenasese n=1 Tax=viral metagenome TaxID=1070528 RepID=A0A6M3KDJ3_9ZZZZ
MLKVKIYGRGWVGKAMKELFPDALMCGSEGFKDKTKADVAFICVPTPLINIKLGPESSIEDILSHGKLDTSIVDSVIADCNDDLIVVRSTVNPGFCDKWDDKDNNIVFQPEYLGETVAHPLLHESDRKFLVIGGKPHNRRKLIELYQTVYNANISIRQMTNYEAEVVKLTENRAIAWKVAQCQELYDACEEAEIDYYTIRDTVYGDDPRFNLWWTFIYPDKRGFKSKCIPKDVYAWSAWAESIGYVPEITNALLRKNEEWIK